MAGLDEQKNITPEFMCEALANRQVDHEFDRNAGNWGLRGAEIGAGTGAALGALTLNPVGVAAGAAGGAVAGYLTGFLAAGTVSDIHRADATWSCHQKANPAAPKPGR